MNWRDMPRLSSLRAFETAARQASFSKAAVELNVTHAAISQQVRQLETYLDRPLLVRSGRGVVLTEDGTVLSRSLTESFGAIARGVTAIAGREASRALHVTTTPTFALGWLLPRLADFRELHPGIELLLNPTPDIVDLALAGIDLAIRFGTGNWPGVEAELLLPSHFVVVARPDLVADIQIDGPADLLSLPWLQETGTNEISRWLAGHGVLMPSLMHITHLPVYMLLPALRDGQGVTATTSAVVEPDVAAGRLSVLFEERRPAEGYYLVKRPGVLRSQARIFATWLRQQAKSPRS